MSAMSRSDDGGRAYTANPVPLAGPRGAPAVRLALSALPDRVAPARVGADRPTIAAPASHSLKMLAF